MKRFKIIYLEITNACNFTCDYCPIDQQTRRKEMMPTEFAKDIIDQIADNDLTEFITFHLMGEPYLHKDLCLLTGYAEDRGLRVRLLTNGSLLETQRNVALFENNLTRLEVGFRTPNDTAFNMRLRGGKLTLDQYIHRTKGVIEDKIRTGTQTELCLKFFIRSHAAALKMADPYEHLTSEGDNIAVATIFRDHVFEMAKKYDRPVGEWANVPIKPIEGEYFIFDGISLAFSRIQEFWVREQRGQSSKPYKAMIGGCSAAFRDDFGILASGEVTTCCIDYDGKNVVGDLRKQTLMQVLESPAAQRMCNSFKMFVPPTEFCKECRGGPTLASSMLKQVGTIALDITERFSSHKDYKSLRKRVKERTANAPALTKSSKSDKKEETLVH